MSDIGRLLRFSAVSGLGMLVQLGLMWVLTAHLHTGVEAASALAVSCAIAHNFAWHRGWTWEDRRAMPAAGAFLRYATANGLVSLAGSVLVTGGLVRMLGLPALAAAVVAIGATGALNYALADRMVFRSPDAGL